MSRTFNKSEKNLTERIKKTFKWTWQYVYRITARDVLAFFDLSYRKCELDDNRKNIFF